MLQLNLRKSSNAARSLTDALRDGRRPVPEGWPLQRDTILLLQEMPGKGKKNMGGGPTKLAGSNQSTGWGGFHDAGGDFAP